MHDRSVAQDKAQPVTPDSTRLEPGASLRVHWGAPRSGSSPPSMAVFEGAGQALRARLAWVYFVGDTGCVDWFADGWLQPPGVMAPLSPHPRTGGGDCPALP